MCVLKYLGSSISIFTMYYEVYPKKLDGLCVDRGVDRKIDT